MNPNLKYSCPMHPEVTSSIKTQCFKCGMDLILTEKPDQTLKHSENSKLSENVPFLAIISVILITVLTITTKDLVNSDFSITKSMSYLMAGFFLVFSTFKLMDLKGFAQGYSTYDLLAGRTKVYAYAYPFIELFLGIFYAFGFTIWVVNLFTFLLMSFSSLGVINSILKKRKIKCACLGTFVKLPLNFVTLTEDLVMASMAFLSLIL